MFGNRYPLLEVVQAIENLRESRGSTNKQICDFVRQQGRNPNDPMKILKTIRTLNKLVEDGVLIKKGKRYTLPLKPPELSETPEEEEKDDCGGNEEENNQNEDDSCDENNEENNEEKKEEEEGEGGEEEGEEDEDDDDDDDDDEDEDDDDDDDDDDECNESEPKPEPDSMSPCPENNGQSKPGNNSEPKPSENCGPDQENTENVVKANNNIMTKKNSLKAGRKNGKGQNGCETKNHGKNKGGEAIAFCARDFIDSQYSQNSTQAKPMAQQKKSQGDLIEIESYGNDPLARAYVMRKRDSKTRKSRAENDCRSRSPFRRDVKSDFFTDLNLGHSDDLRKNMISSQIFQEVTDTPMDIDQDNEAVDLDYDLLRHRSPIESPITTTTGAHLDRTESCCSQPNTKVPENIKAEIDFDCKNQFFLKKNTDLKQSRHSMAQAIDMQNKRLAAKEAAEKGKEKHKRELCAEEGKGIKAENRASLCSVCEKKKRNS